MPPHDRRADPSASSAGGTGGTREPLIPPQAPAPPTATPAPPPPPKSSSTSVVSLACGMLLCGTVNTLLTKYVDLQVVGVDPSTGQPILFSHPAFQSALMFAGELLCLLPWLLFRARRRALKRRRDPAYIPLLSREQRRDLSVRRLAAFALPAICDATASTMMNLGLALTTASTYQMLRGVLCLWTGVFTVAVLRRRLRAHHWMGMALITAGAAIVGVSSVLGAGGGKRPALRGGAGAWRRALMMQASWLESAAPMGGASSPSSAPAPLLGDTLVVVAQAGTALQFVLEEAFLRRYRVPALLAVGLEGAWGCALSAAVLLPLASVIRPGGPGTPPLDDLRAALRDVRSSSGLLAASLVSVFTVAAFNFCGIGVTKRLSGASRATIDATRTLFVWLFALACGWEKALPLQMVGFAVLVAGSSLYNEVLRGCLPGDLMREAGEAAAAVAAAEAAARRVAAAEEARGAGVGEEEGQEVLLVVDSGAAPQQALGWQAALAAAGSSGGGSAPMPVEAPARAASRRSSLAAAAAASGSVGAGPWGGYALARSMRLGAGALSPGSLVPSGGSRLVLGGSDGGGGGGASGAAGGGLLAGAGGSLDVGGVVGGAEEEEEEGGEGASSGSASGSASSSASSVSSDAGGGGDDDAGASSGSLLGPPGYLATAAAGREAGAGAGGGG